MGDCEVLLQTPISLPTARVSMASLQQIVNVQNDDSIVPDNGIHTVVQIPQKPRSAAVRQRTVSTNSFHFASEPRMSLHSLPDQSEAERQFNANWPSFTFSFSKLNQNNFAKDSVPKRVIDLDEIPSEPDTPINQSVQPNKVPRWNAPPWSPTSSPPRESPHFNLPPISVPSEIVPQPAPMTTSISLPGLAMPPSPQVKKTLSATSMLLSTSASSLANVKFPLQVGRTLIIHDLGRIIPDKAGYHSSDRIWPVGYISDRYVNRGSSSTLTAYRCQIVAGVQGPIFQVTSTHPDIKISSKSIDTVWDQLCLHVYPQGSPANTPPDHLSATYFFGLDHSSVRLLIERLPNADKCRFYRKDVRQVSAVQSPAPHVLLEHRRRQESIVSRSRSAPNHRLSPRAPSPRKIPENFKQPGAQTIAMLIPPTELKHVDSGISFNFDPRVHAYTDDSSATDTSPIRLMLTCKDTQEDSGHNTKCLISVNGKVIPTTKFRDPVTINRMCVPGTNVVRITTSSVQPKFVIQLETLFQDDFFQKMLEDDNCLQCDELELHSDGHWVPIIPVTARPRIVIDLTQDEDIIYPPLPIKIKTEPVDILASLPPALH
eukprot:TRINITY_DN10203_c0_g1_i1.p1 TRINITY_DN10203_c0_g1~~TRINITY_DN10203_c0_g1_i1.p1  ORF type:complete len:600 (+),score=105.35 TRINITY_DN10203_c0_g1_i1:152-1951(+)